jgi:hypothetical protein
MRSERARGSTPLGRAVLCAGGPKTEAKAHARSFFILFFFSVFYFKVQMDLNCRFESQTFKYQIEF